MEALFFPPEECPNCHTSIGKPKPATFRGRRIYLEGTGQPLDDTTMADLLGRKLKKVLEEDNE